MKHIKQTGAGENWDYMMRIPMALKLIEMILMGVREKNHTWSLWRTIRTRVERTK